MNFIDKTFSDPAENLACDEVLLNLVEESGEDEILRLWESESYFVVLGSSNKLEHEVYVDRCRVDGVQIQRRHSGGGTVLQGPGCVNYSLILRIDQNGCTRNITETTAYIMQRHARVISALTNEVAEMKGSSDLVIGGKKFSGNAQRRRLNALLFHGTFLIDFDLSRIESYLKLPPKQPEYRASRSHADFVRTVNVDINELKRELTKIWGASQPLRHLPQSQISELVRTKYSQPNWIFKH